MAWSPVPHSATLLATATSAGSLGDSFDASASLEILSLDVANPSADMPVVGRVEIANLAWGAQGTRSHGLLAAGFSTGAISVWDPELILTHSYVAAISPSYFGTGAYSSSSSSSSSSTYRPSAAPTLQRCQPSDLDYRTTYWTRAEPFARLQPDPTQSSWLWCRQLGGLSGATTAAYNS